MILKVRCLDIIEVRLFDTDVDQSAVIAGGGTDALSRVVAAELPLAVTGHVSILLDRDDLRCAKVLHTALLDVIDL